jgi:hypothetical protein
LNVNNTYDDMLASYGIQATSNGTALLGIGGDTGVKGETAATSGKGVYGEATSNSGGYGGYFVGYTGVYGKGTGAMGPGVRGESMHEPGGYFTSTNDAGVFGRSENSWGIYGYAAGDSGATYGVYGRNDSNEGRGVYGYASDGSGATYGVYGQTNSSNGYGVYGVAGAPSGLLPGLFGIGVGVWGDSADQPGLYGTSDNNTGVVGWSNDNPGVGGLSSSGDGVQGTSVSGTGVRGTAPITGAMGVATGGGTTYGVYGKADSLSGKGVYGEGGYFGVHGRGMDPTGTSYGVYGQTESTSVNSYGGYFRNDNNVGLYAEGQDAGSRTAGDIRLAGDWGVIAADDNSDSSISLLSNDDVVVYLDNNDDDATSCFSVYDPGDSAIVPIWEICHEGTAASIVDTEGYGAQKLYAMESPDVWLEDFGSGALVNGVAAIAIDSVFAETVDLDEYHVFLTPLGDCNGLYVAAKTAASFEVRELGGGASNVSFDYRLVAHRLGYEEAQ